MTILLIIIHILVCLFLIAVVLLQSGKGAEMGAAFGGSSQTLFGSRGATSFLSKMTTVAAVVFMLTSLTLAVVTTRGTSVIKKVPQSGQGQTVPATPGPIQGAPLQPQSQQVPQPVQPVQQKAAQAPQAAKPVRQKAIPAQPQATAAPQSAPVTAPQPAQETPQQPTAK